MCVVVVVVCVHTTMWGELGRYGWDVAVYVEVRPCCSLPTVVVVAASWSVLMLAMVGRWVMRRGHATLLTIMARAGPEPTDTPVYYLSQF